MNKYKIKAVFGNDSLSAKGIAARAKIDATSESLRKIEEQCWEMVESGEMAAIDCRDQKQGGLFFRVV